MNDWKTIRKTAIVESDDFQDKYDRNGLEMLFYWKAKYPKFKITLFTIPNKISNNMRELLEREAYWIELAVHGWDHDSNFECWGWDYDKAKTLLQRAWDSNGIGNLWYEKIFKAPGWMITDKTAGYTATEDLPISKNPWGVYDALMDMDFIVVDRHYNKDTRPQGLKTICIDCNPDIIHTHTWDMVTGDLNGKNGLRQVEELHGVPWDQNTEFKFISEAWEEGLIKPCV